MKGALRSILTATATLGPIGRLPIAPGTWGSAAAVVIWWFGLSRLGAATYWPLVAATGILAVWSAHVAEEDLGHDAHPIVIDEVLGQWLTLSFCPLNVWGAAAGFFLFRLFDVWKPFPVDASQRLPGGWGVVTDDVLAGIYAALALHIFLWIIGV